MQGKSGEFPKFLLFVDSERKFLSLSEVQTELFDAGKVPIEVVGLVLQYDSSVRDITAEEEGLITQVIISKLQGE